MSLDQNSLNKCPQDKLANLKNPKKPFKIKLGITSMSYDDDTSAKGEKKAKMKYKIGESVKISFESEKDCYLTLIDIGTSGKVHIVVPNSLNVDNYVRGNRPLYYPEGPDVACIIQGPSGVERIKAFATIDPVNIFDIDLRDPRTLFYTLSEDYLENIINKAKKKFDNLDANKWCDALVEFKIA